MKKARFFIIFFIIFFAICHSSINTFAYETEEAKRLINYQELEEGQEPSEKVDVVIDLNQIVDDEVVPVFDTSIDTILYDEEKMYDINFFKKTEAAPDEEKSSVEPVWLSIKKFVAPAYKIALYISVGAMSTILLYIAVTTVIGGITGKQNASLFGLENILSGISKTPEAEVKHKRMVEQWCISVLLFGFLTVGISLVVYGSDEITRWALGLIRKESDICNYIGVHAKYVDGRQRAAISVDNISSDSLTSEADSELEQNIKKYVDSLPGEWAVVVKNFTTDEEVVNINGSKKLPSASVIKLFIAGAYYDSGRSDLEGYVNLMISQSSNESSNTIIKNIGSENINSFISKNGYSNTVLNRQFGITGYAASNDNFTSANDVSKVLDQIYNRNYVNKAASDKIYNYMLNQSSEHRNKIPTGIPAGTDVANKTGELPSTSYPSGPIENDAAIVEKTGANYSIVVLSANTQNDANAIASIGEISSMVFNGIGGTTSKDKYSTKNQRIDTLEYFFKASVESIMMYKTQLDTDEYMLEGVLCGFCGFMITAFKGALYLLLIIRMYMIAFLTIIVPIMVLINAFLVVNGMEPILKKFAIIFVYWALLKPAITLCYYALLGVNPSNLITNPVYLIFVFFVLIALIAFSIYKLVEMMIAKPKSKQEKQDKKENKKKKK